MMKKKKLAILVPAALIGMTPLGASAQATVDTEPDNEIFAGADTWNWQIESYNDGNIGTTLPLDPDHDDRIDNFRLFGFAPGSPITVIFSRRCWGGSEGTSAASVLRLDILNSTDPLGPTLDEITLSECPGEVNNPNATGQVQVMAPNNGELGLRVQFASGPEERWEGYRIQISAAPASAAAPIPIAGWPLIPVIGAAALAGLRRRQQRPEAKRAA